MRPFFLIADDSEAKQMMLKGMLHRSHWDVAIITAKTTEEAKKQIDRNKPIVAAFVDYEMPSEEGPAVIAYLKKANLDAHIALVSSADSKTYQENARTAGAEAFVCTSYDIDLVEEKIADLLEEWKTR